MSGAEPWAGWNSPWARPDLGAGRHAHAADQARPEVGQDVAEHVLHDQDVELPGFSHQVERRGVDVVMIGPGLREVPGALVEDLPEKGHRGEHVRLVDAGDPALAAARAPALRELEGEVEQALAGLAGDHHGVARDLVVLDRALAARGEQALGRFPEDHEVDVAPRADRRAPSGSWEGP